MPASYFIVGAPRCGTTALSRQLRRHPAVCSSRPKENFFFSWPFPEGASAEDLRREYLSRFFPHLDDSCETTGEGSVAYLYDPAAIERILHVFPEARFIAMVRNPIDMLYSYHARMLYTGDENQADFARAWALQEERARGRRIPRACRDPRLLQYADMGRLGAHVERLLEVADPSRCFVGVFDDLGVNSMGFYAEVCRFLKLSDDGQTQYWRSRRHKRPRWVWPHGFIKRPPEPIARLLPSADRAMGGDEPAAAAKPPPDWATAAVYTVRKTLLGWNQTRAKRPPLDPATWEMLAGVFSDDIARLGRALGRDLGHWLEPQGAVGSSSR